MIREPNIVIQMKIPVVPVSGTVGLLHSQPFEPIHPSPGAPTRVLMTALTESLVRELATEYERLDPFVTVETERLETMPDALAEGAFVWKDAEWVVRWYARRFAEGNLSELEDPFSNNRFEDIERAIGAAVDAPTVEEKIDRLTSLDGVDVPIASAFLHFMEPDRYIVAGPPLWHVLEDAGELDVPYREPMPVDLYVTYLETCRAVARDFEVSLLTLYRGLVRLGSD